MIAPDGHIFVVTQVDEECKAHKGCPDCGSEDYTIHGYKVKVRQAKPMSNGNPVTYLVRVPVYKCNNPNCKRKNFTQKYTILKDYARQTWSLQTQVILIGLFVSSLTAQVILAFLGIPISDSTIRRMIDAVPIPDDPYIDWVGIDEVCLLRGLVYFTIVYNGHTHAPIALMMGRDGVELEKWLSAHPYIVKITRDRYSAFAKVIDAVLPDCAQIADRFHLYKNIIDHIVEVLKKFLPTKLYWSEKDGLLEKKPQGEILISRDVTEDAAYKDLPNYDDARPVDADGQVIEFHYEDPNGAENRKKKEKAEQAYKKAKDLRERFACESTGDHFHDARLRQKLNDELKMPYTTFKAVLDMSDAEVEELKHVTPNPPPPFASMIYKMLKDGIDPAYIFQYVRDHGHSGNLRDLRRRIQDISLFNRFGKLKADAICTFRELPEGVYAFSPSDIAAFLTAKGDTKKAMAEAPADQKEAEKTVAKTPVNQKEAKKATAEAPINEKGAENAIAETPIPPGYVRIAMEEASIGQAGIEKAMVKTPIALAYEAIKVKYPIVAQLEDIYNDFDAMFNQGDPEHPEIPPDPGVLVTFYDKHKNSVLKDYVTHLMSDREAIERAMTMPENSGSVEGGNCRVQLTKRMMFGRAGAEHLLHMLYEAHCIRHDEVDMDGLRSGELPHYERDNQWGALARVVACTIQNGD